MRRILFSLLASLLIVIASPIIVLAHGSIFTFKQIDGPNIIMVTHNVHDAQSGVPITYNVRIYDMTGKPVPFSTVAVEMKRGSRSLEKQTLTRTDNADAVFTYSYPRQGEYTLFVRFMDGDKRVAGSNFPIVVAAGLEDDAKQTDFVPTVVSFFAGVAGGCLLVARSTLAQRFVGLYKKRP